MPHLKRLLAPSFWKLAKKEKKWVATPHAGPHPKLQCIPLSLILKHILKLTDTTTEAKKVIRKGEVFVDGKRRKDHAYPVGLFDVVQIPSIKKAYRIVPRKNGLELVEIADNEVNLKICKIMGKNIIKKGKIQKIY